MVSYPSSGKNVRINLGQLRIKRQIDLQLCDSICAAYVQACLYPVFTELFPAAVVYDVTSKGTFERLDAWLSELETYSTKHDIIKMLVANKIDKVGRSIELLAENQCD